MNDVLREAIGWALLIGSVYGLGAWTMHIAIFGTSLWTGTDEGDGGHWSSTSTSLDATETGPTYKHPYTPADLYPVDERRTET